MERGAGVPTVEQEDARQLHRELLALQQEATMHTNRIKSLLATCGLAIEIDRHFPKKLKELRQWNGTPLPDALHQRLLREFERMQVVNRQARQLQQQRAKQVLEQSGSPAVDQVRKLLGLKGLGIRSSWLYVHEFLPGGTSGTAEKSVLWRAWHRRLTAAARRIVTRESARQGTNECDGWP